MKLVLQNINNNLDSVGLIVPIRSMTWLTKNLLDSLKETTDIKNILLIVADNGSTRKENETIGISLEERGFNFQLYYDPKPVGFVKAVNYGLKTILERNFKYFFIINNDILLTKKWLERLLSTLKKPQVGLVGPVTYKGSWRELPSAQALIKNQIPYANFKRDLERTAVSVARNCWKKEKEVDYLIFFCVGGKVALIKEIGYLDEHFGLGVFDDFDYCYRARQRNFRLVRRQDVYVHHYHKSTFLQFVDDYESFFENNRKLFIRKHGFDPFPILLEQEK